VNVIQACEDIVHEVQQQLLYLVLLASCHEERDDVGPEGFCVHAGSRVPGGEGAVQVEQAEMGTTQ
jgi:hypothetical protein